MTTKPCSPWMERLLRAKDIPDFFERQLYVAAVLSAALAERGISITLVGGAAVEFYTFGGYATRDLDFICPRREDAKAVLAALGFRRERGVRHWYHPELDVVFEIPDERLAGDIGRTLTVEIQGLPLSLIGIEDLILDRLRAHVHWRSQEDGEWVVRLMAAHLDEIDWGYLEDQARSEELVDALTVQRDRAEALVQSQPPGL